MISSKLKIFDKPDTVKQLVSFPFLWIDSWSTIWLRSNYPSGHCRDICLRKGEGARAIHEIGDVTQAVTDNVTAWNSRMIAPHTLELSNGTNEG